LKERDFNEISCLILRVGIKVHFIPGSKDLNSFGEGIFGFLCALRVSSESHSIGDERVVKKNWVP